MLKYSPSQVFPVFKKTYQFHGIRNDGLPRNLLRYGVAGQDTAAKRATGKIIHFETRNTTCRICESVYKSGKRPDTHDCRKNHTGTSKSMEAGAAAEIYEHAKACCIRYSTFIGDEDSTTIARVRQVASKFATKNLLFHKKLE